MSARLPLVLAAALGLSMGSTCGPKPARRPSPTVATLDVVRGHVSLGGGAEAIHGRGRVPRDGTLRTDRDARAMLRLDGGAFVLVDRATELVVHLDRIELRRGRIFVDGRGASPATVETPQGSLGLQDAAFSLSTTSRRSDAYCASGEITYRSPRGSDRFAQGQTLALTDGAPAVEPAAVFDDWTGGLATPARLLTGSPTYVGVLDARAAGAIGVAGEPMSLRSHEIRARVEDDSVRTEVVQTFFNGESETVDGEYRVRVPEGALVASFEVDRGAGFEASVVAPLASPEALARGTAYDGGSARLAFDGPDRYRARIVGIAPGQTIRVRTITTSWLERRGGVRTLVVPLASEAEPPLIGELSIDVDASRSGARRVTSGYGATTSGNSVSYRASDARPRADFFVELFDEAEREQARAYEGTRTFERDRRERFVRIDVPTDRLVELDDVEDAPLDLLVVLDTSGGTDAEDLELARSTIETLLAQITPEDRIAVQLGDVTLHPIAGSPSAPARLDAAARERLLDSIATVSASGATDLGAVLRSASASLAGHANGAVLYLGDGLPTDGAMSATAIARELELVDDPPRLFAIGLGDDADLGLLRALVGDGAVLVRDRDEAGRQVLATLANAGRPVLRDVRVELGESLEQVFPRGGGVVPVGSATSIVARVAGPLPSQLRVRARFGGRELERRFPIERRESVASDDVPRRWAAARLRELLDADAGREAIVELGLGFDLVTPYTPRTIGSSAVTPLTRWRGLDDPDLIAWALGGATPSYALEELGGPRGFRAYGPGDAPIDTVLESTWAPHDSVGGGTGGGDGGLALASVQRVLRTGGRGPQGCFERKLLQRPDLQGAVTVRVSVDGSGHLGAASIVGSTLGVADVDACVLDEVRGLPFPATGGAVVTVEHVYVFVIPNRRIGIAHHCSVASEHDLDARRRLWGERVSAAKQNGASVDAVLAIFRDALASCELGDWRARRTLATMLLSALVGLEPRIQLYQSFADDPIVAPYLRRAILRGLRSGPELAQARARLGLDPSVDWTVFARAYAAAQTKDAKLALVRRWLEVAPDDLDLRLRLLSLLEEGGKGPEARRVARAIAADPLADARARTLVGEFWLRQGDRAEAIRVLSELVERAPLDPWARRRLGDLYLAHGFLEDAHREYETLTRLRPDDSTNLLLLARAAAADGRLDEALRLEQRVSEEADDDVEEGLAAVARAYTTERLALLRASSRDAALGPILADRLRATGVLRSPPDLVVTLVWSHPDDRLTLEWLGPDAVPNEPWTPASTSAPELGLEAFRVLEREDGTYQVRITRADVRDLRAEEATLIVIEHLGQANEHTTTQTISLTRDARERLVVLGAAAP